MNSADEEFVFCLFIEGSILILILIVLGWAINKLSKNRLREWWYKLNDKLFSDDN